MATGCCFSPIGVLPTPARQGQATQGRTSGQTAGLDGRAFPALNWLYQSTGDSHADPVVILRKVVAGRRLFEPPREQHALRHQFMTITAYTKQEKRARARFSLHVPEGCGLSRVSSSVHAVENHHQRGVINRTPNRPGAPQSSSSASAASTSWPTDGCMPGVGARARRVAPELAHTLTPAERWAPPSALLIAQLIHKVEIHHAT